MTANQIHQRYPLLKIPKSYFGIEIKKDQAGVVRVKQSLKAFEDLSRGQGADLRYEQEVSRINEQTGEVFMSDGKILRANRIVLAAGCYS